MGTPPTDAAVSAAEACQLKKRPGQRVFTLVVASVLHLPLHSPPPPPPPASSLQRLSAKGRTCGRQGTSGMHPWVSLFFICIFMVERIQLLALRNIAHSGSRSVQPPRDANKIMGNAQMHPGSRGPHTPHHQDGGVTAATDTTPPASASSVQEPRLPPSPPPCPGASSPPTPTT